MIEINCETDFVAKNADFAGMAEAMAKIALENGLDTIEALKAAKFDGKLTVAEKLIEQTGVIGEKIDISACQEVKAAFDPQNLFNPGNIVDPAPLVRPPDIQAP